MSDVEKGDHLIALYDIRIWEGDELVFMALGMQGGGAAHTLADQWLKRRRSPGVVQGHRCDVDARLVSAKSIYGQAQR